MKSPKALLKIIISLFTILGAASSLASEDIKLTCVGTYSFLDNGANIIDDTISENSLETLLIVKRGSEVTEFNISIHSASSSKDGDTIVETEKHVIGNAIDSHTARVLMKFNKSNQSILLVANFSNGIVNTYEGECY
jgi:hypothetical protein